MMEPLDFDSYTSSYDEDIMNSLELDFKDNLSDEDKENLNNFVNDATLAISNFVRKTELTSNGMALMASFISQKSKSNKKICLIQTNDDLEKIYSHFIQSTETYLPILFKDKMNGHWLVIVCEKKDAVNYIAIVDSVSIKATVFFDNLIQTFESVASTDNTIFLYNNTAQQGSSTDCATFALKNISKVLKVVSFVDEIMKNNITFRETSSENYRIYYYRLPARFMNICESRTTLINYTASFKPAQRKDFYATVFKVRNNYGIATPEQEKPTSHDQTDCSSASIQYLKNHTIRFFRNKYTKHTIPNLFKQLVKSGTNQADLRSRLFSVSPKNFITTKKQKLVSQKNTFARVLAQKIK